MKIKLLRCSICENWHLPQRHCPTCGAHHVPRIISPTYNVNKNGISMARGIPLPVDKLIERVIRHCQEQ